MMNWLKGLILKKFNVFKHQNTFIRTKDKFPALVAGYGSGKTVAMCLKAILECGRNPNKIILLAEPVYPMIKDVLQPTLENTLDELGFTYDYKASYIRYTVKWNVGQSYIILRSAENWRRWAGLNLACFGIDEGALLKDDSAWKMGISRLRDGKHLTGFTTTTPEGFNWVYEKWCENIKDGYILYNGKTTDNKYLPKEFVETLYDNYDKKLVEAYIDLLMTSTVQSFPSTAYDSTKTPEYSAGPKVSGWNWYMRGLMNQVVNGGFNRHQHWNRFAVTRSTQKYINNKSEIDTEVYSVGVTPLQDDMFKAVRAVSNPRLGGAYDSYEIKSLSEQNGFSRDEIRYWLYYAKELSDKREVHVMIQHHEPYTSSDVERFTRAVDEFIIQSEGEQRQNWRR